MKNFINFLWSGFGTGVTALRAFGGAIIFFLFGFIAIYYIVRWIVRLFTKNSGQSPRSGERIEPESSLK